MKHLCNLVVNSWPTLCCRCRPFTQLVIHVKFEHAERINCVNTVWCDSILNRDAFFSAVFTHIWMRIRITINYATMGILWRWVQNQFKHFKPWTVLSATEKIETSNNDARMKIQRRQHNTTPHCISIKLVHIENEHFFQHCRPMWVCVEDSINQKCMY